jgi:hypothetical protein
VTDGQLLLPFDEFQVEEKKEVVELPSFSDPCTDNERLLQFQYEFRHGDANALQKMYTLGFRISMKFINAEAKRNRHIRHLSTDEKMEKANDATTYIIEQYLKREDFAILKNWPGYLFLRIQHELYYRRKVDEIVDFIDMDILQSYETEYEGSVWEVTGRFRYKKDKNKG